MSAYSVHGGKTSHMSQYSPHPDLPCDNKPGFNLFTSFSSQICLQCPLDKAPRCFKTVLARALELGESNFIPTNWRGFSDHFKLQELRVRDAGELVEAWADLHPYRHEHTLLKIVEYAQATGHRKLLQDLEQTFRDHLIPEQKWTQVQDPAECFETCHSCSTIPLSRYVRSNSRSSDDIRSRGEHQSDKTEEHGRKIQPNHTHRRTHSLPKDIQIAPKCQGGQNCNTASSVTNIYHMSCCCRNSPFTPSTTATPSGHFSSGQHRILTQSPPSANGKNEHYDHDSPTDSALNFSFPDSDGETFVAPTELQRTHHEPRSSNTARQRLVSLPPHSSNSHAPSGKQLKQTHSSAELYDRPTTVTNRANISDSRLYKLEHVSAVERVDKTMCSHVDERKMEEEVEQRRERDIDTQDGEKDGVTNNQESGVIEVARENEKRERVDVMQEFGHQLFDTPPYNLVQRFYNSHSREAIILILASFFLYNGLRAILQNMCTDGGFHTVFTNQDGTLAEATRRVMMLSLRILTLVITPLCLCVHISVIAAKPRIPKTNFTEKEAVERMMCVHRNFSPHYEVKFLQSQPQSVFQMTGIMTKRHINSIWMSILNSLLFSCLFGYIGGLNLGAKGVIEGGVCQFLSVSIIHIPLLNRDIHILVVLDLLLALGVLFTNHTLKDYYYYENRIAVFSVTVGREATKLYSEIRGRWIILDVFCYLTAVGLLIMSFTLASVNKTIIPDPSSTLQPEDLVNWFFWISVLTAITFLGWSSNRLIKKTTFPAYIIVVLLINIVNLRIDAIPPATMNVFFLVSVSGLVINLLLSLCYCHYHHFRRTQSKTSLFLLLLSLCLVTLLPIAVAGTVYREIVHLAAFVHW